MRITGQMEGASADVETAGLRSTLSGEKRADLNKFQDFLLVTPEEMRGKGEVTRG